MRSPYAPVLLPLLLAAALAAPGGDAARAASAPCDDWIHKVALHGTTQAEIDRYCKANQLGREQFREEFWKKEEHRYPRLSSSPEESQRLYMKRVDYAGEKFRENQSAGWTTQRGFVFVFVEPPARRHVGTVTWTGEGLAIDSLKKLVAHLKSRESAGASGAGSAPAPVSGGDSDIMSLFEDAAPPPPAPAGKGVPGEVWIYPAASPGMVRVLTFAESGGVYSLVKDEIVQESQAAVPSGTPETFGAEWFETPVERVFEALPVPQGEPVLPKYKPYYFLGPAGRTEVDVVTAFSAKAADAAGLPVSWSAGARTVLRISDRAGKPLEQVEVKASDPVGSICSPEGCRTRLTILVPPGSYRAEMVLLGSDGRGGSRAFDLEVPDLGRGLELSTPVLARAKTDASGQPELPPGAPGTFIYGRRGALPLFGEDAMFRPGNWIAVLVQVYGARAATARFTLTNEAGQEGVLGEHSITPEKGGELVQLTQVVGGPEGWPPGKYQIDIQVKEGEGGVTAFAKPVVFRVGE